MPILQIVALAFTIFVTTVDDLLWLIPYVSNHAASKWVKIVHSLSFILTLQLVCLGCSVLAYTTRSLVVNEHMVEWIGAGLAWLMAIFFYVKKMLKRRRKKAEKALMSIESEAQECCQIASDASKNINHNYSSIVQEEIISNPVDDALLQKNDAPESKDGKHLGDLITAQPLQVAALTFVGALDEISYFPAILLSKTFTVIDLHVAALIACLAVLLVVQLLLVTCMPAIEWLDKNIQLYGVIAIFATLLTIEAIFD